MKIDTLKIIANNFCDEIIKAKNGEDTSLPFLISQIPKKPLTKKAELFQVMVIGGSIFKSALCEIKNSEVNICQLKIKKQPTFATKEQFFSFVLSHLEDNITNLALNFAQSMKPTFIENKLDGIFIKGSKGSRFEGLENEIVGQELEVFLQSHLNRMIVVAVGNDTICLLLSGLTKYSYNEVAGGILGTGLNFTFFLSKNVAVNLESASFDNFPQSNEGEIIDRLSTIPGYHLFEKEVAGAYLFKRFNLLLGSQKIKNTPIRSTEELTEIAQNGSGDFAYLARDVFFYSASLVACQIAGIVMYKQQDLIFVMQGSLFWNGYHYYKTVEMVTKKLISKHKVKFVNIENSDILGGAKLIA